MQIGTAPVAGARAPNGLHHALTWSDDVDFFLSAGQSGINPASIYHRGGTQPDDDPLALTPLRFMQANAIRKAQAVQ